MPNTLKELEDKLKRIKMEKELIKLTGKKTKKTVRKATQKIKSDVTESREDLDKLIKKRQELAGKIGKAKAGAKGFFGKLSVHLRGGAALGRAGREIKEKQKFLRMKGQIKGLRTQRELEEERAKIRKLREKRRINLSMSEITRPIQPIKAEDIFG